MGVTPRPALVHGQPRQDIGRTLRGDVLEIGPGHAPFPTSDDARVTFVDRSVEGGRDATWPELVGQPRGPDSDLDLDLDISGLRPLADEAFDVVIASHLIEHLANPVEAMREFERVLRPGGRLVLIVPDRTRTFDSVRQPTPLAHVLEDFDRGVTEVDDLHIREFCEAIFNQPPIHPDEVRGWYDPSELDEARLDLHRRRSIHVHCWTPEEFAILIAGGLARALMSWDLVDMYFFDDPGAEQDNEFGLVLERPLWPAPPPARCETFIREWVQLVLGRPNRDPHRVVALHEALLSNTGAVPDLASIAPVLSQALCDQLVSSRGLDKAYQERLALAEGDFARLTGQLRACERRLADVLTSRSYRVGRMLSATFRMFRRKT